MTAESRTCRLCDENNDQMYSVFEINVLNIQIIKMIQNCLPIIIYKDDPLSKYICHSCNENLNMFCEFKKSCIEIAKKHNEDLEQQSGTMLEDEAVEIYLNKIKDFEDNFSEEHASNSIPHNSTDVDVPFEDTMYDSMEQDNSSVTDMDIDHEAPNNVPLERCNTECGFGIQHKPRISGPKSQTNLYTKVLKTDEVVYQPLSLLELVVQCINKENISDFVVTYSREDMLVNECIRYCCRYCEVLFEEETELAVHELETHIQLHLQRVDKGPSWSHIDDAHLIRNKWMEGHLGEGSAINSAADDDNTNSMDGGDVDDLLVPIVEEKIGDDEQEPPPVDTSRNCPIYFVDKEPYAKGVPLKELEKDVRNTFYQSVTLLGVKKKWCQLCRYTYRDNWSIDMHYFTNVCYHSCNYCGLKFKRRNAWEFPAHVAAHEAAGHKKSMCVYSFNSRGDMVEYDASLLKPFVPQTVLFGAAATSKTTSTSTPTTNTNTQKPVAAKPPPPKPTPMKLRVRQSLTGTLRNDTPSPPPDVKIPYNRPKKAVSNAELVKNQAYFCKKCYQVFTKLDNFNTHMTVCTGEIDSADMSVRSYKKKDGVQTTNKGNNTKKMPALNPLPTPGIKIKQENGIITTAPVDNFPCHICSSVFKTIYSRNSHMRIHVRNKPGQQKSQKRAASLPLPVHAAKKIKQESFEPIVEIHEGATTTIGSVSITPLRKITTTTSGVSPDVIKLVQNNPNISFKPRPQHQTPPRQSMIDRTRSQINTPTRSPQSGDDGDSTKGYKCAQCFQLFANKSNLYFHKKNQCTGSRFPCPFCKKRFGTANEYSSHIFYSHPE